MSQPNSDLAFSASTIKSWFQYRCERKTRYETFSRDQLDAIPVSRVETPALWADFGKEFERKVVSQLGKKHAVLMPSPDEFTISQASSVAFLRRNHRTNYEFAYQLSLDAPRSIPGLFGLPPNASIRRSIPDLVRVEMENGVPMFRIIDIKATQITTLFHKAQVAFYALVLRSTLAELGLQSAVAEEGEIWHLTNKTPGVSYVPESFRLRSYEHLVLDFFRNKVPLLAKQQVSKERDSTFFHIYYKCEQCDYLAHCRKSIEKQISPQDRDVSAVPGLSHESKRALLRMNIRTVGELAGARGLRNSKSVFSWALQSRSDQLIARSNALISGTVTRLPDRYTYLMPARVDVGFFLCVDTDPVEGNLATIGYMRARKDATTFTIEALPNGNHKNEAACLRKVLGTLLSDLSSIDQHNATCSESEKVYSHIFLFEASEANGLQDALARHLDDDAIRRGLLELIRIFPPEDAIPEPEYRGVHHLPATTLRTVVEQLYAVPATVSYDLRQVTAALGTASPPLTELYTPLPGFERDFSSRLSIDVCRRMRAGKISPTAVINDVKSRLRAMAALVEWILADNANAQSPFLRLNKQPFRFQNKFHPLNATDLDLLQAQELLESRAGLLSALVELAMPLEQRRDRLRCLADLKLIRWGKDGWRYSILFAVPEASRQAELGAGDLGLIISDDDPAIRLNPLRWRDLRVELAPKQDAAGTTVTVFLTPSVFNGQDVQRLLVNNGPWHIDKTFQDFNSGRVLTLLQFLARSEDKR